MSQTTRLLFVSALLNAICWIVAIPVWQYPDEQAHFAQIQYISEIGGIPKDSQSYDTSYEVSLSEQILGTERDEQGNNKFTYHPNYTINYSNSLMGPREKEISSLTKGQRQNLVKNEATLNPPLYYFLGSYVYNLFSGGNLFSRVYSIRFISAAIFMINILFAYKIGRLIFEKEHLAITLASTVAYMPMLVFASTGILPDTLTNLLFTLFIFVCLKIIKENISIPKTIVLLLIILLGSITRQHFLITLGILPFLITEQLLVNKNSRKTIAVSFMGLVVVLYALSFFIGSLSFISRFDFPESSQRIPVNPLSNLTYIEHFKWTIKHSISETWPWYWGVYRWLSLSLPHVVYQIINRIIPFALIGVLIKFLEIIKKKHLKKNIPLIFLLISITVYFLALTTFDYLFRKNNGFSFGFQGRYFFPTIVAQMTLLIIGFNKLFEIVLASLAKYGLFAISLIFVVFNLFSLVFVSSTYYDFSSVKTAILQMSQYKPLVFKGNILLVIFGLSLLSQVTFLSSFARSVIKLKK